MTQAGGTWKTGKDGSRFAITMMFHPTLHVTDLSEAERWFKRVLWSIKHDPSFDLAGNTAASGISPGLLFLHAH